MSPAVDDARRRLDEASRAGSPEAVARASCDLGVALFETGDEEGARAVWQWVIDTGDLEQTPRALRNLAICVRRGGNHEAARELLRRAISMNHPEWSREAGLDLATMYERDGDRAAAVATVAPMTQWPEAESTALGQFVRGRWFELQGDTAAALAAFEEVLSRPDNPKTALAARHLAAIYDRADKAESAKWALRRAVETSMAQGDRHEEGHARASFGELLARLQQTEAARTEFARAAEVGCPTVRAQSHYRLGRFDLTESDAMPAPRRRRRLAEQAVAHFRQALEDGRAELAVNLRLSLGYGYELMDDTATAREMYETALEVATPAEGGFTLLAFAEFLVRQKLWPEANPVLDSLVENAASPVAERARKVRDKAPR